MTKYENFAYRPEIDSIRAIAVIAVIIHHLSTSLLPGGFLGVDVFFVISGYVITSSLLKHRDQQSISTFLIEFYGRRIRRILPALIACIIVTALATWLLIPGHSIQLPLQTAKAAVLGFSNIVLFNDVVDYFTPAASLNPFTQTWSLGVEEQFYLIFPAILWFLPKQSGGIYKNGIMAFILFLVLMAEVSFYVFNQLISNKAAFYLMPFRFWELATGSILCIYNRPPTTAGNKVTMLALQVFLLALIISLFFVPESYAAYSTVFCVVATLLFIATLNNETPLKRFMQSGPLVFVGLISYSLYLWHWPILSLSHWTIGVNSTTIVFQLIAVICAALVSYYLIERPFRSGLPQLKSVFVVCIGAASICASYFALQHLQTSKEILTLRSDHFAKSFAIPPDFTDIHINNLHYNPACVLSPSSTDLPPDMFGNCSAAPVGQATQSIWVLGDSHAGHLQAMLKELHETMGFGIHLIETPGYPFPLPAGVSFPPREKIVEKIKQKLKPNDIIIIARLSFQRTDEAIPPVVRGIDEWVSDVGRFSGMMAKQNVSVVAFGPTPMFNILTQRNCYWTFLGYDQCSFERAPQYQVVHSILDKLNAEALKNQNLKIFDAFSETCPSINKTCGVFADGRIIFKDRDHFNSMGSQKLAAPFFNFLQSNNLSR